MESYTGEKFEWLELHMHNLFGIAVHAEHKVRNESNVRNTKIEGFVGRKEKEL